MLDALTMALCPKLWPYNVSKPITEIPFMMSLFLIALANTSAAGINRKVDSVGPLHKDVEAVPPKKKKNATTEPWNY